MASLPVLDLRDFLSGSVSQQQQFVQNLGQALETVGFFALEHHGISQNLIQTAYGAAADFFTLPTATKQRYERPEIHRQRGFTRFGQEHAKDSAAADLKEFWHVGREAELPNPWPQEVPAFQPAMAELYQQLEHCAAHLLRACAVYLELPDHFFDIEAAEGKSILRILHYPPVAEEVPLNGLRAAPHEDINLITLLCESTGPGLELWHNGDWLAVESLPGQIIVDTGDMLQAFTNGLFRSTTHRVVNHDIGRTRRFSLPFFMHPRAVFDLTPQSSCIQRTGGQALFPGQTAGDYLHQRLQEIGLA
ncbi:MAG: 2-oxoglutarate and iron-dependent oxygenase domain-containing protein [Cyanobacteria bacterium J06642_11]